MIRVTLEMWPHGDESGKYSLGHLDIYNVGTNENQRRGNYRSRFFSKTGFPLQKTGEVANWPRKTKPVMSLLKAVLEAAGY